MKPPLCTLFAILLSALAGAQSYSGIASQAPWDPDIELGTIRKVGIGRFDGDGYPDAVILSGRQLILYESPAFKDVHGPFGLPAKDFAVWDRGDSDLLVTAEIFGICVYAPSVQNHGFEVPEALLVGDVARAEGIELETDPLTGQTWLAVQAHDERSFVVGTLQICAPYCFGEEGRWSFPAPPLAWQLVQWDGLPGMEIAAHTPTSFEVRRADGTVLLSQPLLPVSTQPLLGGFRPTTGGFDRLFWLTENTGPDDLFGLVIDQRFPLLEPPSIPLATSTGQVDFTDYDGDGTLDLWFSTERTGQAFLLYGDPMAVFPADPTFSIRPASTTVFDLTGGSTAMPTTASIGDAADLDLDGDVDFLFASAEFAHVNFLRGDSVDEEQQIARVQSYTSQQNGTSLQLDLVVALPAGNAPLHPGNRRLGRPGRPALNPLSFLTVEVWRQADPSLDVDLEPIVSVAQPLSASDTQLGVSLTIDTSLSLPTTVYQMVLRVTNGSGRGTGPPWIAYFTTDPATNTLLAAQSNPWNEPPILRPGPGVVPQLHRRPHVGPHCLFCPQGGGSSGFHKRAYVGGLCWFCP